MNPLMAAWPGVADLNARYARKARVNICTKGSDHAGSGPGANDRAWMAPRSSSPAYCRPKRCRKFKCLLVGVGRRDGIGVVELDMQPQGPLGVGAHDGDI